MGNAGGDEFTLERGEAAPLPRVLLNREEDWRGLCQPCRDAHRQDDPVRHDRELGVEAVLEALAGLHDQGFGFGGVRLVVLDHE